STVTLFLVGYRTKEIIENLLGSDFAGWLMSDGYKVYRNYLKRLRCWAHLVRKARGLAESLDTDDAQPFGKTALALLEELMKAVYQAREGPPVNLYPQYAERLAQFKALCEQYRDCSHEKTRALAREFLYDWDPIWIVLQYPWLPLTNNEAERALRHWVIARQISHGTRTEQGTRAFALLASVIDTCRKRGVSPWPYIAEVIAERRKGNPAPPLPASAR
ncbi:MAG: transposase, partial [bacterium]|nr:transposase [bacterium]